MNLTKPEGPMNQSAPKLKQIALLVLCIITGALTTIVYAGDPVVTFDTDFALPSMPTGDGSGTPVCIDRSSGLLVAGCIGAEGPPGATGPAGTQCKTFEGVTTGSGPHYLYVGSRNHINTTFSPASIIGNAEVSEANQQNYDAISSIDEVLLRVPGSESILFSLNVQDGSAYRKLILRNKILMTGKFRVFVWNNPQLVWDMVTIKNPVFSLLDEEYSKLAKDMGQYIDENNDVFFIYEGTGGNPTNFLFTTIQKGYSEATEVSTVNPTARTENLTGGEYFYLFSANDVTAYYVWFDLTGDGTTDDPMGLGSGIRVDISALTLPDDNGVAVALKNAIDANIDFRATIYANTITIENTNFGETTNISDLNTGFLFGTEIEGHDNSPEITTIDTTGTFGGLAGGEYFVISSSSSTFYFWLDTIGDGITQRPAPPYAGSIPVHVDISGASGDQAIASVLQAALNDLSFFNASSVGNVVTVENVNIGEVNPVVDASGNFHFDWFELCMQGPTGPIESKTLARNWQFGNAQGGGGGNVGLEIALPKMTSQGYVTSVLLSKFGVIEGESINSIKILLYSNQSFELSAKLFEHSFDPSNFYAPPTLVAESGTFAVFEMGAGAYDKTPQWVTLNFDSSVVLSEESASLYLSNKSISGTTASIGIYQVIVE